MGGTGSRDWSGDLTALERSLERSLERCRGVLSQSVDWPGRGLDGDIPGVLFFCHFFFSSVSWGCLYVPGGWRAQGPRGRCGRAAHGLAEVARLGGCSGPLAGSNVDGDCDFQHMAAVPCICKREAVG